MVYTINCKAYISCTLPLRWFLQFALVTQLFRSKWKWLIFFSLGALNEKLSHFNLKSLVKFLFRQWLIFLGQNDSFFLSEHWERKLSLLTQKVESLKTKTFKFVIYCIGFPTGSLVPEKKEPHGTRHMSFYGSFSNKLFLKIKSLKKKKKKKKKLWTRCFVETRIGHTARSSASLAYCTEQKPCVPNRDIVAKLTNILY